MSIFTGSGVAIVTPFNESGVDYKALGELIEFHIEGNTDCIVICGTTGEASTMTAEEQLECIRFTIEKVAGRIPVIAGTGSNNTAHALHLTQEAERMGADGALIVTPYYNRTSQKGLYEHYSYIAERVNIPIVLYNVPSRSGMAIAPQTAAELSKIDNIVAIKEASGNIGAIGEMMALCEGRLDLYSGNDDQVIPLLSLGGLGVISVVANVAPQISHDMVDHWMKGDIVEARNIQFKLNELNKAMFCENNPMPVKEAMNQMGLNAGPCRLPLTEIAPENKEKVATALKNFGLLG